MNRIDKSNPARRVPSWLKAMGRRSLPTTFERDDRTYTLGKVFKNDFFAVTAMYEGGGERVILKVHRQASFLLIPLRWVGRWLAAKECAAFARLADVAGVPKLIGRWGDTGVVREYVEGHPLARGEAVADDFYESLRSLIAVMHDRGMAYVDLEKCENVLVGDDGKPYLFDFQISWYLPRRRGGELWPFTSIRRRLQVGDRYHLVKLQRRTRPDQLTVAQRAASYHKPWYVRAHRVVTYPFTWCRRRILDRLDPPRAEGERGRVPDNDTMGVIRR